jgi:hypothetical protein
MGKTLEVRTEDHTIELNIDRYPDICPICHKGIDARFFDGYLSENQASMTPLQKRVDEYCPNWDLLNERKV